MVDSIAPTESAASPHDALFKATFAQPDLARSELEVVLPVELRAQLDLSTLAVCSGSFVDQVLQQTHSDLLYTVRTRSGDEGLVYVLFEHQSSSDRAMPLRLLHYMVRIWDRWRLDHLGTTTLPIVIPVVLHHAAGIWRPAPELSSMFDASPELLAAARPYVPHFRFVLDDLAALGSQAIASRPLDDLPRLVQLALWASRSLERLLEAKPLLRAIVARFEWDLRVRSLFRQFTKYIHQTAPPDVDTEVINTILLEIGGPEGQEDVMNSAEQLRMQGEQKGQAEGERRGLRTAIETALSVRAVPLSEVGRGRLASCTDVTTLTHWLTRAMTAASEAEVFADAEAGR